MSKANGCSAHSGGISNSSSPSKYTRTTELRRVEDNDIYKLARLLDQNACWRKLMSIIPKGMDTQVCSAAGLFNYEEVAVNGFKYTADHISLMDDAEKRLRADESMSQVMLDEWRTSGKLHERPTVGVLLQLLVHAELFSAADLVASDFLNEPKPLRPAAGPAAHISFDLSADDLCEDMDVDNDGASYQPNTSALNAAAAQMGVGSVGLNLDYFDKHMVQRDKSVPQQAENGAVPIAPPRLVRSMRQQKSTATANALPTAVSAVSSTPSTPNVPILSILNASSSMVTADEPPQQPTNALNEQAAPLAPAQNVPHLSILNASSTLEEDSKGSGAASGIITSTSKPNVPLITLLIENSSCDIGASAAATTTTTTATTKAIATATATSSFNNLPKISALNLNADSENAETHGNGDNVDSRSSSSTSSLSNDDDDDDEDVDEEEELPNLSNSEHQNSNNDSSLTTVTGTSGENSFELTNDSSSASNDDSTNNIPNLSELQQ